MNRLANETSPYLLQHAHNPVAWFPWGPAAFEEAARRDVPIFLSIGYSTCHWCHVMARESFHDTATAEILNDRFVAVKVDREERPDVEAAYIAAVEAMVDVGGWPMSVFLTPTGEPFFAGTYWPTEPRDGQPSFVNVLVAVSDVWNNQRQRVVASTEAVAALLAERRRQRPATALDLATVDTAAGAVLERHWDPEHGGFEPAPKFPRAMTIEWLLYRHARTGDEVSLQAAVHTLVAMARGGLHDQVGGGFSRYSTDGLWLVPHFEKMLYDNALLLPVYAAASALTNRKDFANVARMTVEHLLTMRKSPHGAFVSAIDAETEGAEGRYYVWPFQELVDVCETVGVSPQLWATFLGATPDGNWTGQNILHWPVPAAEFADRNGIPRVEFERQWSELRAALHRRRCLRAAPGVDGKVMTDWNALAIRGLVRAGQLLNEPDWIAAATVAANFLHDHLIEDGELHHIWTNERPSVPAFLDDYAALALADLELFQATGDTLWFERAASLTDQAHDRFRDNSDGGWFQTREGGALNIRPKISRDDTTPAGASVMTEVHLILAALTGNWGWREHAEGELLRRQDDIRRNPLAHGWVLRLLEGLAGPQREVVVVASPSRQRDRLGRAATTRPRPGTIVVLAVPDHDDRVPLLAGRRAIAGQPTAYVCHNHACARPVTKAEELITLLSG